MLGPWFSRTGDGKGAEDQIQVAPSPSAQEDSEQTAPEARYDAHVDDDDDDGSPSGNNFTTSHDTYLAMLRAPQPTASGKTVAETTQPETLFDPFTGADLGQLTSTGQPATRPAAREEVWAHLGRVLALQSEVARMHVQMESIGARAPEARLEATRRWGLGRTQSGLGIEGEEEEEEERRRERDEEFERLTGKFTGRKEGIDAIMNKVRTHSIMQSCIMLEAVFTARRDVTGDHCFPRDGNAYYRPITVTTRINKGLARSHNSNG